MKGKLLEVNDYKMNSFDVGLPYSIRSAAKKLHEHFRNVFDMNDCDEKALQKIQVDSEIDEMEEVEVDYGKLPGEQSVEKLDDFASEVDQVSIRQLKKKIILERASSRNSIRSRRNSTSISRQASDRAE